MKRGFVQVKKYSCKKGASRQHLNHVLRIKSTIQNPKVIVEGNVDDIFKHKAKRNDAVDYLELMVYTSPENKQEFEKIMGYIKDMFKRPVVAVSHYDESHPHTHFLIPWRWTDENGKVKSIRLSKGDFFKIGDDIAKMQNREIVRGQGRKSLSLAEYIQNPEGARKKIDEMTKQRDYILEGLEEVLNMYGEIEIVAISEKGKFTVGRYRNINDIPIRKLVAINEKGNGIYFQPTENSKPVVFLDDIPEGYTSIFPLVIRTSEKKYQVHLPFETDMDIGYIQKVLAKHFGADKGATARFQPRRLIGFKNFKYHPPFIVEYQKRNINENVNKFINNIIVKALEKEKQEQSFKSKYQYIPVRFKEFKEKVWNDFYDGDESVADMKYTHYLLSLGYSDEEIKAILLNESKDIHARKRNHLEQYLELTISKAKKYRNIEIKPSLWQTFKFHKLKKP